MNAYVYHTDSAVFELPAGFVDRSVTVLEWPSSRGGRVALTMQREPAQGDEPLEVVVRQNLAKMARVLKGFKETGVHVQAAPRLARVSFELKQESSRLVQHQLYVPTDDGLLVFGATARHEDRAECETLFDHVIRTLKFRAT